jgi:peptidoglycan/LPS O-acetylase OafA/YrhL
MNNLSKKLDMGSNSLNLIRLSLALFVVVGHSFGIGGFPGEIWIGNISLGFLSVGCFFAISGFLISMSRSKGSLKSFLWKRLIRIIPGYLLAYLLTSFLFSPIAGLFQGGWTIDAALSYLIEGLKFFIFGSQVIGTTLEGLPHPGSWNGSLWSVRVEVMLYVLTAIVFLFSKISQTRLVLLSGFVLCSLGSVLFKSGLIIDPTPVSILSTLCFFVPFYLAGSLLFLEKEKIRLDTKTILSSAVAVVIAFYAPGLTVLAAAPIGITVLALGSMRPLKKLSHFSRHDYSYGVYVLSFPIQQTLAAIGVSQAGLGVYMFLSLVFSLLFAWLSWHLVESQALKLKRLVR